MSQAEEFVEYVHRFYGPNGIYPIGASHEQIRKATEQILSENFPPVLFDSVDRERVRTILERDLYRGRDHDPAASSR